MFATTLTIDAPKRKAPASGAVSSRQSHYGLSNDSSVALGLVALSRVAQVRDDDILQPAAQTPVGASLIALLKAAALRVARSDAGGADPSFDELSVASLFNLSASVVATQRLYDGGLSLPAKLPWPRAKALVNAMLGALNAVRATDLGARVGTALMRVPAAPLDAAVQVDLAALVAAAEEQTLARLSGASGSTGSASTAGGSSAGDDAEPSMRMPTAVAVPIPDAIEPTLTLSANARRLVEARLSRRLVDLEAQRLEEALAEALSVLQVGGDDARRRLLSTTEMATALLDPGASMLWACVTETATQGSVSSAATFGTALVATASTMAGALFASAFGV